MKDEQLKSFQIVECTVSIVFTENAWDGSAMPSTALFGVAMPSHVRPMGGNNDLALHRPTTQLQVNTLRYTVKKAGNLFNYSRSGGVWLVTSRLGTGENR
jgi:hypothetical protein